VPSLSLSIVGLYCFTEWTRDHEWLPFFLAAIAISLAILIKVTSMVIFAPLLYLECADMSASATGRIHRGELSRAVPQSRDRRTPKLFLFAAIAILPSVAWYWHAHQIAEKFYPHHFFGSGGIRIENLSWYWDIARETATSGLTPILTVMALIGLFVAPRLQRCSTAGRLRSKQSLLFHWWLAAMILFVIIVGYGNRHRWYQLPLVPIAAAFAGAACAFFGSKISSRHVAVTLSILLATLFAILAFAYVRPLYEPSAGQLRDAGLELSKTTAPDALIVAADTGDPTIFYYAHRKGWHFLEENGIYGGNPSDSQAAIDDLEELRRRGATHLVFTANTVWWLGSYPEFADHIARVATLMETTPEFRIYRLRPE
jgi:hypothetical protein